MFVFAFSSFAVVILCAQVWRGFPPLYRNTVRASTSTGAPSHEEAIFSLKTVVPAGAATIVSIFFGHPFAMFLAGIVGIFCALRIRARLRSEIEALSPSMIHPFPVKWPMFAFDAWTAGITAFFAMLFL